MSARFYLTVEIETSKLKENEKISLYSLKLLSKYGQVKQIMNRRWPIEHLFIELESDNGNSLIDFVEQYKNVIL